jgi:hypothetical protein
MMSGCSKEKSTKDWIVDEVAGIDNPGFTITSKEETSNYVSFVLEDIDIEMVNGFIDDLTLNPDFTFNVNYVYDSNSGSYSYAAFNEQEESIHFTYNEEDHTGYFIYAKSGDSVFNPGIRDMGYSVRADYDYTSNDDYTAYIASMFYGFSLNAKSTSSGEYLISFVLKDFEFLSDSIVGDLTFCEHAYNGSEDNYQVTGTSVYEMNFGVCQKNIGQYSISVEFGSANSFEAMGITQSDLDFTVSFTAEVTTYLGTYTHDYTIKIMPSGYDVTTMDNLMDVDQYPKTFDEGTPYTLID